jgi:hypothetical protein
MHPHAQCQPPPRPYHPLGPALQPDEQESYVFNETSVDIVIAPFPSFLKKHAFPYMFATITGGVT